MQIAMQEKVAFIGLGVMGYPMAGHLHNAGHQVTVFNRTCSKAKAWVMEYQGNMAATPREASQQADIVFIFSPKPPTLVGGYH